MADKTQRLDTNVSGNFYVDATCINCDTCRQLAPSTFQEVGDYSTVVQQPQGRQQQLQAYQALLACPVGSIGTEHSNKTLLQEAKGSFPLPLEGGVFYCGFNSEKSFGANSYVLKYPDGNWLIDSPRYVKPLIDAFEQIGGIAFIFLTHEDDVADADRYARHFGAQRIIHRADAGVAPDAEWIIEGTGAIKAAPDFLIIPVPGHTPGSQALLYRNRFLFTGDHLWWDPDRRQLAAPRKLVWNGSQLVGSIEKLLAYRFEWVLPGHGERVHLNQDELGTKVQELLDQRRSAMRV